MKSAAEARATWLANVPVYPLTAAQRVEESNRFVRASRRGLRELSRLRAIREMSARS